MFITGVTGYLGSLVLEQLLRTCPGEREGGVMGYLGSLVLEQLLRTCPGERERQGGTAD